ncbi:MAG: cytochrome d ubiquinol oxidase subunit II [Pseudomonadota bacterium]
MELSALPQIWAGIIAFAILVYVVLDGFDLGVGMLFAFTRNESWRTQMHAAIAPVWDGNETWLILIGASLFGAFPLIYAIFLSAFYVPVTLMLFALIFRGVSFEFRHQAPAHRGLWDWGLISGSAVATFVQGAAIGTMVQGLPIVESRYAGDGWEWFAAFPVFCGFGLMIGYTLLGACWLVLKCSGELRIWAVDLIRPLTLSVLAFLGLVLFHALWAEMPVMRRWVEVPSMAVLPVLGAFAAYGLLRWPQRAKSDWMPFALTAGIFLAAFLTLASSFWPYMVPFSITVDDAAAPQASLSFMFYGAALFAFPVVIIYTTAVYWIFRGKVGDPTGHH